MDEQVQVTPASDAAETAMERTSDREFVVTRTFQAPPQPVYEAWTTPELLKRWWAPRSFGVVLVSCEVDARPGGSYRFLMGHPSFEQPMAFFGRYLEAAAPSRLVWTNEEAGGEGPVTAVIFEKTGDGTRVALHESYPSKAALDNAVASQSMCGYAETFDQLDALLAGAA